jgi:hypothetical protein
VILTDARFIHYKTRYAYGTDGTVDATVRTAYNDRAEHVGA